MPVLETEEMLTNIAYGRKIMRTVYDTIIMHVTEENMLICLAVIRYCKSKSLYVSTLFRVTIATRLVNAKFSLLSVEVCVLLGYAAASVGVRCPTSHLQGSKCPMIGHSDPRR